MVKGDVMNLLTDKAFRIREGRNVKHVSYEEILCQENDWVSSMFFSDMEFAQLQMLICMTQVIFEPKDFDERQNQYNKPMLKKEFDKGVKKFRKFFEVVDSKTPFMQLYSEEVRIKTNKKSPQSLYPPLPKGNNKIIFNAHNEIENVCPSCVAKLLFFRPLNGPSMGGGFASLSRGSLKKVPGKKNPTIVSCPSISVLREDDSLRKTIWANVLHKESTEGVYGDNNEPVWTSPWKPDKLEDMSKCGMFRGLFYQPWPIALDWKEKKKTKCDLCGAEVDVILDSWYSGKIKLPRTGWFNHPHSISRMPEDNPNTIRHHVGFREGETVWSDFLWYFFKKDFFCEPPYIMRDVAGDVNPKNSHFRALVGGYRLNSKMTNIDQKCFDSISIHRGFFGNKTVLSKIIEKITEVRQALDFALLKLGNGENNRRFKTRTIANNAIREANQRFFFEIEALVFNALDKEIMYEELDDFLSSLKTTVREIFEDQTEPFSDKLAKQVAYGKNTLESKLSKINKEDEDE